MGKALAVACAGAVGLALALSGLAGGGTKVVTLRGTVGPGFTITLTKAGKPVTRLAPGRYRIVVRDPLGDPQLRDREVGRRVRATVTSVGFQGTRTITVRLTRGQWEVYCAPHESTMKRHIGVGVAPKNDD